MDKPLVLLVDDERDVTLATAKLIDSTGKYQVVTANSAKDAFSILKKNKNLFGLGPNRIRLILLDIKMPEMDGLQFLNELRKTHKADEIGVIMATAYEDEEKWDRATDNFVVGYIVKPIDPDKLLITIDRFFSGDKEAANMTMETFERHIDKREQFKKEKEDKPKS